MNIAEMSARLAAFIDEQTGGASEVRDLERMPGGFSYETWRLTASWLERGERKVSSLIMRKAPRAGLLEPYDASVEFRVLKALADSGVPTPEVYWCNPTGSVLGTSFYIMEFIEGDVPLPWGDAVPEEQRLEIKRQFTDVLAKLHTFDWEAKGLSFLGVPKERTDPAALALDRCEELLDRVKLRPHPVLREVIHYLRVRKPYCPRLSLVHNDYRMGNFVWRDGKIRAVLDWERVYIGDPMADIAFTRLLHLAGWCSISGEMAGRYEQRSGIVVDEDRVRYWTLLETLKADLVGLTALKVFADGRSSDLRLVQIGIDAIVNNIPAEAEAIGLGK
ncbi:hypothetical protein ACG33_07905 [Steroidobacter denitrificans]|uniref:Aminoglycoside phosphotransferase domain-containing protein n=1 Tax=Steroidobacter denitrificans TaxID=465721 RepID=A0A127FBL1_STEDE|nr:phosphotransferase family protein [Steroidobacter denitrificans]AMN47021.1 hypothetical protein ACG33_07905 [Steroidobacter denitrificans]